MNQAARTGADNGAVHPDVLEVAPDHELQAVGKHAGVPVAYHLGHERSDLAAPGDDGMGQVIHNFVDVPLHHGIRRERLSHDRDRFLQGGPQAR